MGLYIHAPMERLRVRGSWHERRRASCGGKWAGCETKGRGKNPEKREKKKKREKREVNGDAQMRRM